MEKLAKGLYTIFINDNAPRIHDLNKIIQSFTTYLSISLNEEQKIFLDQLSTFYIDTRYPDFKQSLAKCLNNQKAEIILAKTEEIFSCLLISQK
ncbi:MAG: HEPN domain-containing protein [Deltaproteobacteria bacterium]|nr:HEPN domain-containing protein [Deltaproteobacteria bacterium]